MTFFKVFENEIKTFVALIGSTLKSIVWGNAEIFNINYVIMIENYVW